MPRKIRAVFFDAGNTLVYPQLDVIAAGLTAKGHASTVDDFHASDRIGKARFDEWLWPQLRNGNVPRQVDPFYWTEYLKALIERLKVPEATREEVVAWLVERFKDITIWSKIYDDTVPFLESLQKRGYYLGVISNSIGTMEQQLVRVGLAPHFETIIDSAIVGVEKPHPEIFHMALKRANVAASEAVFVGDTYPTDIGGARLAGLTGVLIDRVRAYPNADCPRIETLSALDAILEKIAR